MGVGEIHSAGSSMFHFRVYKLDDILNVIIPHFDDYPLLTQKRADFLLFKAIVDLMNKKEHLQIEGLKKIVNLKASLNKGLPLSLKEAFPNATAIENL